MEHIKEKSELVTEQIEDKAGVARHIESISMWTLGLFAISTLTSQTGISFFGGMSLLVLLVWRYYLGYKPVLEIPSHIKWAAALFTLSLFISIFVSTDHSYAWSVFKRVWYILFVGLLATCPLGSGKRRVLAMVFMGTAAIAGFTGAIQLFAFGARAHGFTHPVHFGGMMAVGAATALVLLFVPNETVPSSGRIRNFFWASGALSALGMLSSMTRSVLAAFVVASVIVLVSINWRKGLMLILALVIMFAFSFAGSETVRYRTGLFVKSVSNPAKSDLSDRLKVWDGAILIFKKSPLLGTGTGDWHADIRKLTKTKKIERTKNKAARVQAHNLYLHWLATQGAVGIMALLLFLGSMVLWGLRMVRTGHRAGGHLLLFGTIVIMVWGMTEANLLISKFLAALSFAVGVTAGTLDRDEDQAEQEQERI
ncbi:MAG: O-antigen ligase family protein [Thermodesulfovibrionales bacterium]|nr:O-antigen ligase family protein [Thermodesulfovibrionales bacterium]